MMKKPQCFIRNCKHFRGIKQFGGLGEMDERVVCLAFPEGIPDVIAYGQHKHLTPYPGDNGIQYKEA